MRSSILLACAAMCALAACSSNDTTASGDAGPDAASAQDAGRDSGGGQDAGVDSATGTDAGIDSAAPVDAGVDAAEAGPATLPLNGCDTNNLVDRSGAADSRVITGPGGAAPSQYAPPCMKIKAGQSVTWNSDFTDHPLEPLGGDSPNPITGASSGTTVQYSFPTAGLYGFHCGVHQTSMQGAIQVVP